jgi:translation initiation factor IF-2
LVNTVETLNNQAPAHSSISKEDIEIIVGNIVEEAVEKGGKKLKEELQKERKEEMIAFEATIVKAANTYATNLHEDVKKQIRDIQTNLSLALKGLQQLTRPDTTSSQDLLNPE